ncbi:hypothetical protein SBV1_1840009 [Verrucomicrobia bacterium]|nr:hypothetical protein SBV1_1840009 [Verrucomicrobiota bacterium]
MVLRSALHGHADQHADPARRARQHARTHGGGTLYAPPDYKSLVLVAPDPRNTGDQREGKGAGAPLNVQAFSVTSL